MTLTPGTRLGPYEVAAQIGVGGMGEVYRATDTDLSRQVAIKVLPEAVAGDAERVARFEREAKTLAALNHPNIAQIHGLERSGGTLALVMELVEGPTLADRIAQGAMLVDEALPIARQIAEALEAAHEQGIIHRDLKPANIKVRPDGAVKVLDFGLAKAMEPAGAAAANASQAPTITTPAMTQAGVILGTAAYMSPEQARGKPVDRRTDIWAFGCVVFEMVTGRRAFEGEDVGDTLASVVKMQPNLGLVPPRLRPLVERCLEKDPRRRVRDIGDWTLLLGEGTVGHPPAVPASVSSSVRWLWPAAAAVLAVTAAIAFWAPWRVSPVRVPMQMQTFPAGLDPTSMLGFEASPDGRSVVIRTSQQLWLWPLDSLNATALPGTEGAAIGLWSPDSRSLVFAANGALRRIDIGGGPAQTIVSGGVGSPSAGGWGAWNENGIILFLNPDGGLSRVPARGGEATPVVKPARAGGHLDAPVFLPDGNHFLYLDHTTVDERMRGVYVGSIDAGPDEQPTTPVLAADDGPRLVRDAGWRYPQVMFLRQGEMLAQTFDTDTLKPVGDAIPIVSGVFGGDGDGWFSTSVTGDVLLYRPGPGIASSQARDRVVAIVDRDGGRQTLNAVPGSYRSPSVSPDGTRVAVESQDTDGRSTIWVYDLSGASAIRQLPGPGNSGRPLWSPDGRRLTFTSDREGTVSLYWQPADGSGPAERLTQAEADTEHWPDSWSPDGRTLAYTVVTPSDPGSVWLLSLDRPGTPELFADAPLRQNGAAFSPDGRWLAYTTNEQPLTSAGPGSANIVVRPFPSTGATYPITRGDLGAGGAIPHWSRDGRRLFYRRPTVGSQVIAVGIDTSAGVTFSEERPLNLQGFAINQYYRDYDLLPDGRFVMLFDAGEERPAAAARPQINVVLNWVDRLVASDTSR